jgi:hypothetical protein
MSRFRPASNRPLFAGALPTSGEAVRNGYRVVRRIPADAAGILVAKSKPSSMTRADANACPGNLAPVLHTSSNFAVKCLSTGGSSMMRKPRICARRSKISMVASIT